MEPLPPALWILAISGLFVGFGIILAIIYDLFAWHYNWTTISRFTLQWGKEYPFIPAIIGLVTGFFLGLLTGHFWWPQTVVDLIMR